MSHPTDLRKIKLYLFARSDVDGPDALPGAKDRTARLLDGMTADIEEYLGQVVSGARG